MYVMYESDVSKDYQERTTGLVLSEPEIIRQLESIA